MIMIKPFKYVKKCFEKLYNMSYGKETIITRTYNSNNPPSENHIYDDERTGLNSNSEENNIIINNNTNFIQWSDTIIFVPPINEGQVIKVYDGDTITIAAKLPYSGSPLYRFSVRLNGIDSPEIKGGAEEEKIAAKKSKKALEEIILHKTVVLKNVSTEKYGRILADVYFNDLHLNNWMVENGYAIKYDGGKKQKYGEGDWKVE